MSDLKNKSKEMDPEAAFTMPIHYVIAAVYAVLTVTAFSLNTLVIWAFVKDRTLRTRSNSLILSIAVGDWLHAVLAYPLGVVKNASESWRLSGGACTWYAFITSFLSFGIMLHYATFSIERAITINFSEALFYIERKLGLIIAGLWLFALLWSSFPLFGWSAYVPEGAGVCCSIRWQSSDPLDITFVACIFLFFFFGPVVTMVIAYYSVYNNMKKMTLNAHGLWGENAAPTMEVIQAEGKIGRMAFMMSTCFLFAWTPYAVVSLYAIINQPEDITPLVATLPALFAKTAPCYNPVIYFLSYKKFRESLKRTLRRQRNTRAVSRLWQH